jgi:hypothetical protein
LGNLDVWGYGFELGRGEIRRSGVLLGVYDVPAGFSHNGNILKKLRTFGALLWVVSFPWGVAAGYGISPFQG